MTSLRRAFSGNPPSVKIDFGDVFGSGFGLVVRQIFLFIVAVWKGCGIAAASFIAGSAVAGSRIDAEDFGIVLVSPLLLFSGWLLPNLVFLAITGCRLTVYSESTGLRTWGTLVGAEALFSMAVVTRELDREWPAIATAWACCLVLIAMACTALWFLHQWQINRWAGELAMLQAENEMRRAEMKEEFGTESAGHRETLPD